MRIRFQLGTLMTSRLVQSTGLRMIYPFMMVFARSLGVGLPALTLLLSVRSGLGVLSPLLGAASDRLPRRTALVGGMTVFALANLAVGFFPTYGVLFAGLCLSYLAMIFFYSTAQAHLGDVVTYARRGQAFALQELGWGLSLVIGVPLGGLLIARSGLRWPFIALALVGLILTVILLWAIPNQPARPAGKAWPGFGNLRQVLAAPGARAILAMMVCFGALNEWMMVVFGLWMESSFALQIAALGASAAVIGAAEISGEFAGSAGLGDRLGKKCAVRFGLGLNIVALLAMPWLGGTLWGALGALFCYYMGFEFAFVSVLPLASEVTPFARATLMGAIVAAVSIGRVVSTSLSPLIFTTWGFTANAYAAMLLTITALLFFSLVRLQDPVGD